MNQHRSSNNSSEEEYGLSYDRFYVIVSASALSMLQSWNWAFFAVIPVTSNDLFGFTDSTQAFLLNIGCITFLCYSYINSMVTEYSIRWATIMASSFLFAATYLRLKGIYDAENRLTYIYLSAVFNGLAGCYANCIGSSISSRWFKPESRTVTTGIVTMMNANGVLFASIIGPTYFDGCSLDTAAPEPSNCLHLMKNYNWILLFFLFMMGITFLYYFPNHPPKPVSHSATVKRVDYLRSYVNLLSNKQYLIIMTVFGLMIGTTDSFSALFTKIITNYGVSEVNSGYIGFISGMCIIAATFSFGYLNDNYTESRGYVIKVITIASAGTLACIYLYLLILPNYIYSVVIGILYISYKYLIKAIHVIINELMSELVFPVSEGITNNFSNFWKNIIQILILSLPYFIGAGTEYVLCILSLNVLACVLIMFYIHENNRLKDDLMVCDDAKTPKGIKK